MECISPVTFLYISLWLGPSKDLWAFISGQKWLKIGIFGQKPRLKVNNSDFKCHWSFSLAYSISIMTSLWISVHPRAIWTGGPSFRAQNRWIFTYFCQIWCLKVNNLNSKWYWSTLLVKRISHVTFRLISLYFRPWIDLYTFFSGPKWLKIRVFGQNCGSRSVILVLNNFDRIYW